MASMKIYLVKYFLSQSFDVQQIDVTEKTMRLRVSNFKAKFIVSDKTLIVDYEELLYVML